MVHLVENKKTFIVSAEDLRKWLEIDDDCGVTISGVRGEVSTYHDGNYEMQLAQPNDHYNRGAVEVIVWENVTKQNNTVDKI